MEVLAILFVLLYALMPPFDVMAVVNAVIFYTFFYRLRAAATGCGNSRCVLIVTAGFPLLAIAAFNTLQHPRSWELTVTDNLLRLVVTSLPSSLLLAVALVHDTRSWIVGLVPLAAVAASYLMVASNVRWELSFATWQLVCVYGLVRFAQPAWAARFLQDAERQSTPTVPGSPRPLASAPPHSA